MRTSITDVARAASVTPAVVSRVLNGDPTLRVREATRGRVVAAARKLNYTPSQAARALRQRRSGALGLAVHDLANPVYAEIIIGAQKAAADADYVLLLADVEGLAGGDETFGRAVRGGAIDGLLLQRSGAKSDRQILQAAGAEIPIVLVNDRSATRSSVALDDEAGTRLATEHLIDLGHTRIAHLQLGGPSRSGARIRGWRHALSEAGLTANETWLVYGGPTVDLGYTGMCQLLGAADLPTAVVVGSALAAIGALTAARDVGVRVPHDISVVAFHDLALASHLVPSLTTVAMPLHGLGAAAVNLLLELLAGGTPRHLVLRDPKPHLVQRGSTAPPSA